jgi:hypothetical protein
LAIRIPRYILGKMLAPKDSYKEFQLYLCFLPFCRLKLELEFSHACFVAFEVSLYLLHYCYFRELLPHCIITPPVFYCGLIQDPPRLCCSRLIQGCLCFMLCLICSQLGDTDVEEEGKPPKEKKNIQTSAYP